MKTVYSQTTENEAINDLTSYCKYITEKNKAQSTLLKSPEAIVRIANGDINNNFQNIAIAALSKDLADFKKASEVKQLMYDECTYYKLSQEAKLQIEFAIPSVKIEALNYKLQEIQLAKKKLMHLLRSIKRKINSNNDTIQSYYDVDKSLKKLEDAERQIYVDLASQEITQIKHVNLNNLLRNLQIAQRKLQKTVNTLKKQDNWSLQLQAGAQQNWANYQNQTLKNQTIQPYFALFLRYNLGSISSNHQVDMSLNSFMDWKKKQVMGTQNKLSHLISLITSLKAAEENRWRYLTKNYQKYYGLSKNLKAINSIEALHFKQQLEVDRILMNIEIKFVHRTVELLQNMY